jgi:hypothetical protein
MADPELVTAAVLQALGSPDQDDDTCLVALQVTGPQPGRAAGAG